MGPMNPNIDHAYTWEEQAIHDQLFKQCLFSIAASMSTTIFVILLSVRTAHIHYRIEFPFYIRVSMSSKLFLTHRRQYMALIDLREKTQMAA